MTNSKTHNVLVTLGTTNGSIAFQQPDGFYATDPKSTNMCIEWLLKQDKNFFNGSFFYEPCNGMGHISNILRNNFFNQATYTSDLINYGISTDRIVNYFSVNEKPAAGKMIIFTNPPYKYALEFLKHSYDIMDKGDYYIFLGRIQFLEGKERRKFFNDNPPKYVLVHSSRINCWKDGIKPVDAKGKALTSAVCYSWYIFEKGFTGSPQIGWL